jgi:hypothetical protein
MTLQVLDCTLRDGGYYNSWDFGIDLINDYLKAMSAISVDYVELGFRSLDTAGFKGGCAYTTDSFIKKLDIPSELKLGVMINASEILNHRKRQASTLSQLFKPSSKSPLTLVRIVCHMHEFESSLSLKDFFYLIWLILCYPFRTLRLIAKEESEDDNIFNINLLKDISNQGIDSFSRYIFGRNISKIRNINKIYSWSEFQNLERSFNYAIRKDSNIKIFACQFYINYPAYFSSVVQDIDELLGYAPHKVLVNGKEYIVDNNIDYQLGVSLRYNKVFKYKREDNGSSTIVLGSYLIGETNNLLGVIQGLDNVVFKGHPAIHISTIKAYLLKGIQTTNEDIYDLFPNAAIVVGAASGTLLEAVACGASVIVVAQKEGLITNPLVDFGKGKIWDIVFSEIELKIKYRELLVFRENNQDEINTIADWYKDNFFVEPTVENISKVFELE